MPREHVCLLCGARSMRCILFPGRSTSQRRTWLQALSMRDEQLRLRGGNYICRDHFAEEDFDSESNLRSQATPQPMRPSSTNDLLAEGNEVPQHRRRILVKAEPTEQCPEASSSSSWHGEEEGRGGVSSSNSSAHTLVTTIKREPLDGTPELHELTTNLDRTKFSSNPTRSYGPQPDSTHSPDRGTGVSSSTDDVEDSAMQDNAVSSSSLDHECAVCLQPFSHPVRLPCSHMFCFLCAKGFASQHGRCAFCRAPIPQGYMDLPVLVPEEHQASTSVDSKFTWYYEGRNGWWQFEERLSDELEQALQRGETEHDLQIAGFIYVIDMQRMVQFRKDRPVRTRRIKRDHVTAPRKGIAGLPSQPSNATTTRVMPPPSPRSASSIVSRPRSSAKEPLAPPIMVKPRTRGSDGNASLAQSAKTQPPKREARLNPILSGLLDQSGTAKAAAAAAAATQSPASSRRTPAPSTTSPSVGVSVVSGPPVSAVPSANVTSSSKPSTPYIIRATSKTRPPKQISIPSVSQLEKVITESIQRGVDVNPKNLPTFMASSSRSSPMPQSDGQSSPSNSTASSVQCFVGTLQNQVTSVMQGLPDETTSTIGQSPPPSPSTSQQLNTRSKLSKNESNFESKVIEVMEKPVAMEQVAREMELAKRRLPPTSAAVLVVPQRLPLTPPSEANQSNTIVISGRLVTADQSGNLLSSAPYPQTGLEPMPSPQIVQHVSDQQKMTTSLDIYEPTIPMSSRVSIEGPSPVASAVSDALSAINAEPAYHETHEYTSNIEHEFISNGQAFGHERQREELHVREHLDLQQQQHQQQQCSQVPQPSEVLHNESSTAEMDPFTEVQMSTSELSPGPVSIVDDEVEEAPPDTTQMDSVHIIDDEEEPPPVVGSASHEDVVIDLTDTTEVHSQMVLSIPAQKDTELSARRRRPPLLPAKISPLCRSSLTPNIACVRRSTIKPTLPQLKPSSVKPVIPSEKKSQTTAEDRTASVELQPSSGEDSTSKTPSVTDQSSTMETSAVAESADVTTESRRTSAASEEHCPTKRRRQQSSQEEAAAEDDDPRSSPQPDTPAQAESIGQRRSSRPKVLTPKAMAASLETSKELQSGGRPSDLDVDLSSTLKHRPVLTSRLSRPLRRTLTPTRLAVCPNLPSKTESLPSAVAATSDPVTAGGNTSESPRRGRRPKLVPCIVKKSPQARGSADRTSAVLASTKEDSAADAENDPTEPASKTSVERREDDCTGGNKAENDGDAVEASTHVTTQKATESVDGAGQGHGVDGTGLTSINLKEEPEVEVAGVGSPMILQKNLCCPLCDYKTHTQLFLNIHKKSHRPNLSCSTCHKVFPDQQSVKEHEEAEHQSVTPSCAEDSKQSIEKLLHCPNCEYKTRHQVYMSRHMTLKHADDGV